VSAALDFLPEWLRWLVLLAGLALGAIVVIAAGLAALGLAVMGAEASWRGAKHLTLWLADMLVKLALLLVVDLIGAGCPYRTEAEQEPWGAFSVPGWRKRQN
jgi:hypothetical protein